MLMDYVIPVSHALVHVLWLLSFTRLVLGEFGTTHSFRALVYRGCPAGTQ